MNVLNLRNLTFRHLVESSDSGLNEDKKTRNKKTNADMMIAPNIGARFHLRC